METRQSQKYEETVVGVNGKPTIFETIKIPYIFENKVEGVIAVARDISYRKQIEEQVMLASLAKTQFLAQMSHEIRTPLNSIIGFSDLALNLPQDSQIRDFYTYISNIKESGIILNNIINDILDISKVESGKMELENVPFDLKQIFIRCIKNVEAVVEEKNINCSYYIDSKIPLRLSGDPTRIFQILLNLLSNAVKFTETGSVRIEAHLQEEQENKHIIKIICQDTGIGMSKEHLLRIYEPFVQADDSITRKYGGTGLGLFIVKNIVELMDGTIDIKSHMGIGSVFTLVLTFDKVPETYQEDQVIKKHPVFNANILVAEDNRMNQNILIEQLSRLGISASIANNGQEAVDMIKSKAYNNFDLVFMDINMPVLDGISATKLIKNIDKDLPIIAITANAMVEDYEEYEKAGIRGYLTKPFLAEQLWDLLSQFLKPIGYKSLEDLLDRLKDIERKKKFDQKIRKEFLKANTGIDQRIKEAIKNQDISSAHRYAHTLKSNAGQVNQTELQKIAAVVELALKNKKNETTYDMLEKLSKELASSIINIKGLAYESERKEESTNKNITNEILDRLENALKVSSVESIDILEQIPNNNQFKEIKYLVEDFEFNRAYQGLIKLRKNLN